MSVTVKSDKFPALVRNLEARISEVVRKTAFDIEAKAKEAAPVETGALRNAIYAVTDQGGDYAEASAAALAANPKAQVLPEVDAPPPGQAIVAVGVAHGAFVELGTERQAPQPFLLPAAAQAAAGFQAALGQALKKAANGG